MQKVFQTVCYRLPASQADLDQLSKMKNDFKSGYSMKTAFAEAAVYCMGN